MDNLKYIPAARMRAAKHSHRNLLAMLRMSTLLKKRQRVKLYIYIVVLLEVRMRRI